MREPNELLPRKRVLQVLPICLLEEALVEVVREKELLNRRLGPEKCIPVARHIPSRGTFRLQGEFLDLYAVRPQAVGANICQPAVLLWVKILLLDQLDRYGASITRVLDEKQVLVSPSLTLLGEPRK